MKLLNLDEIWEAEVAGAALTVRWGRQGGPMRSRTLNFGDPALAVRERDRLAADRRRQGFVDEEIHEALEARVADRQSAADKRLVDMAAWLRPAPREPALEGALRQSPDDPETFLVYADFLQGHAHPLGELIATSIMAPAKAEPLRRTCADAFQLECAGEEWARAWSPMGLLNEVSCRSEAPHRQILDAPCCLLLRGLDLQHSDSLPLLRRAAEQSWAPGLERLTVLSVRQPLRETLPLAKYAATHFPNLRTLGLLGMEVDLAQVDLPRLERLEALVNDRAFPGRPSTLAPVLSRAVLPSLIELKVHEAGDGFLAALASSPLVPRLRRLEFANWHVSEEGTLALAAAAPAFASLVKLVIPWGNLSMEADRRLAAAFGTRREIDRTGYADAYSTHWE